MTSFDPGTRASNSSCPIDGVVGCFSGHAGNGGERLAAGLKVALVNAVVVIGRGRRR